MTEEAIQAAYDGDEVLQALIQQNSDLSSTYMKHTNYSSYSPLHNEWMAKHYAIVSQIYNRRREILMEIGVTE